MISIKSIDRHISHDSSVGVCIAKRLRIYRIGKMPWSASCLSVPRYVAGLSVEFWSLPLCVVKWRCGLSWFSSGLCLYA